MDKQANVIEQILSGVDIYINSKECKNTDKVFALRKRIVEKIEKQENGIIDNDPILEQIFSNM